MSYENKISNAVSRIKQNPDQFKDYIFQQLDQRRNDQLDFMKIREGKNVSSSSPLSFKPEF